MSGRSNARRRAWQAVALALCAGAGIASQALAQASVQTSAAPALRLMSLDECVAAALRDNPDVISSKYELAAASAERSAARGEFGPKLHAEGNVTQWNSPFSLPFGAGGAMPTLFRVRDAFTWATTISLIQPLSALFVIYDNYALQKLGVDVATIHRQATRRDTIYRVHEAYYRSLEASAVAEIASASVDELVAQLRQANALHDNGVTDRSDVLRIELALAAARERLIEARGQKDLARERLGTSMGLRAPGAIDAQPLSSQPETQSVPATAEVEQKALLERVELREVERRIEQHEHAVSLARSKLAPRVDLIASYQHNEGSEFVQRNAAYVGVSATWDVWDWGTTLGGIDAALAHLKQAETGRDQLQATIRLEVHEAHVRLQSAAEAITVAKAAIAQAEENYRLVGKRYAASLATSFDTIDAEALLTQARGQLQTSTYDYLVAQVALQRASGVMPVGAIEP